MYRSVNFLIGRGTVGNRGKCPVVRSIANYCNVKKGAFPFLAHYCVTLASPETIFGRTPSPSGVNTNESGVIFLQLWVNFLRRDLVQKSHV